MAEIKRYRLKGNFEKYNAGDELPPEAVDRYLKLYPYMLETISETGEATAPEPEAIEAAKANIEKKRRPSRTKKPDTEKPAEAVEQSTAKPGDK